ncbi:MAG: 2-dehydropantoate 2-reductase N-terminal domain-containing protein, partial [Pseudomonadota bacterium]|nr:2-dehydropantoate 2-reductase N-terminal domain-containing protein [Pseudomonadota bacterium]
MKFCVFGAGAIGGFVGGMVSRGGAEVSLIARGRHLAAIRTAGLQVVTPTENFTVNVPATDKPEDLGIQDVIFLSTKAYSLIVASEAMQPLIGPETTVVSAQNGIPFWYFYGLGNNLEGHTLQTVDPGGKIASTIGNHRV